MCVKAASLPLVLRLAGLLAWSQAEAVPVQPQGSLCRLPAPGRQGFPLGVPGRAGVPTWHRHIPLSLVTGARSHCLCLEGGGPKAVPVLCPQGVTHQQWYLFNDFLIEPVDKVSVCGVRRWLWVPMGGSAQPHTLSPPRARSARRCSST